jgi:secreted trypsin-like serine protease
MARIKTDYENRWCSGALIAPRWVLTTASCIHWHDAVEVHIGSKDLVSGGTVVPGYWELKHENWNKFHIGDDIALVSLTKPVSEKPIKIADSAMVGDMVRRLGGVQCSGCGPTELREVDTKLLETGRCNNIEPGEELCSTLPLHEDGSGYCPRESGGPLVAKIGTEWRLVGLAARWSSIKDDPSACGEISTNVPHYKAWAEDLMQKFDDAHPGG